MSRSERYFPVRPKPYIDEWFSGYVLRIADRNGRRDLNNLCRTLDVDHRKNNYVVGHPQYKVFVEACSGYLKKTPDEITSHFHQTSTPWSHDEHRLIRDIRLTSPKICPHCVMESGYFKAEWQCAHVTHCSQHAVMLLDHCPCCHNPFKWVSKLFRQCPACDAAWSGVELALSPIPAYQYASEVNHTTESLRSLYAALLFTLRPNDLIFDTVQTLNIDNATLHRHLLQAHALLTDCNFRREWFETHPHNNTLKPMYDGIPLDAYLDQLAKTYGNQTVSESDRRILVNKCDVPLVVRKSRLAVATSPEDLNHQLGLNEAAVFLGLSGNEVFELVESGILTALNAPRTLRDQLFDVRDLNMLNQRMRQRALPATEAECSDLVSLSDIFGKLKYFGMNKAQLISTLSRAEDFVLYSDHQSSDWRNIRVSEAALLSLLDGIFTTLLPEVISGKVFRIMCGLSDSQLRNLITNTDLHYAGWHETDQIKVDVAQSFFNDYLLLNRIAKLYNYDLKLTYERLTDLCLEPVFELSEKKPVIVYSKKIITQATLFAICFMPLQSKSNTTLQESSLPRNQNLNQ